VSGTASPIDILYLTHNYPRFPGDFAGSFIARLAEGLSAPSRRIRVLAPHHPGVPETEDMKGVLVTRFRYGSDSQETIAYRGDLGKISLAGPRGAMAHRRFFSSFRKVALAIVKSESPRVIHAHWWIPAGWVACRLPFKGKLLVTLHGTDLRLLRSKRYLRPLASRVFKRANTITVVSTWIKDALQQMFPSLEPKLCVTPMPPNDAAFCKDSATGAANEVPVILAVTRFTAQKRNAILLHALAALRDAGFDYRARFIGEGPLQTELEVLTGSLNLGDRVTFDAPMPQADLAIAYRSADIVILPAVEEGFGMTLVEAQLCGTAVVGVRSGGLRDIIEHEKTGLLASPDDPGDLANALRKLVSDEGLRHQLAQAGCESAKRQFSSAAIVGKFAEWYDA
jgi:glycosyltransferase involved in cell wall biosynthesis